MELQCRYCRKSFSKGEHLRRHERTHTGAKPFSCNTCKRAFARQDSLMRHERLHTRHSHSVSSTVVSPTSPTAFPHPITPESVETAPSPTIQGSTHGTASVELEQTVLQNASSQDSYGGARDLLLPPSELNFELIWPDTEDLFQTILQTDFNQASLSMGTFILDPPTTIDPALSMPTNSSDRRPESMASSIPLGENQKAVQALSNLISNMSSSVTAAAESTLISSVFLDECLNFFWLRFIPTLPVVHRATFVFKDCTQQLLLNAIAIGSLYLGPKDAVAKGEALWHLAHTAIATSWQTLITHRGPYDSAPGVQLVLSALLSQVYGALSKNRSIRATSQAFRALAFSWARHCNMHDSQQYDINHLPSLASSEDEKDRQWRIWAARENQQRALLAHYILDGLISQMTGEPTSTRHATNKLCMPSTENAFDAVTADEWLTQMHTETPQKPCFRVMLRELFKPPAKAAHSALANQAPTAFCFRVILEAIQSLMADSDGDPSAVGVPNKAEVEQALTRLHENIINAVGLSNSDRLETLLRWHTVCLDLIMESSVLCRHLCKVLSIEQHLWRGGREAFLPDFDLVRWVSTSAARRALLHAIAIQAIVEQLPRGRAHVVHMPSSLFSAATIYATFAFAAMHSVKVPATVVWREVLLDVEQAYFTLAEMSNPTLVSDTVRFVRGEAFFGSSNRNLLYELNSIQKLFRCLYSQWGIALDMEAVVDQWIKLCR